MNFFINWMQIGGEAIENLLINIILGKKELKKHSSEKDTIPCLFTCW
jgi:hypothetical protein